MYTFRIFLGSCYVPWHAIVGMVRQPAAIFFSMAIQNDRAGSYHAQEAFFKITTK